MAHPATSPASCSTAGLTLLFTLFVSSLWATPFHPHAARAAAGDGIAMIQLPVPGNGVSVAVDCDGIVYFTNAGDARLHKMDKTGRLLASLPTLERSKGKSTPVFIDEMAWDDTRKALWSVEHGSDPVDVYQIDPETGAATFKFTSQTTSVGSFRDGLAFEPGDPSDPTDDVLWISGDVSTTIERYDTSGTLLGQITPTDANGNVLGSISGVIVGVGDLLYLGQAGRAEIVQVRKSDGTFIAKFASPGGVRDEGLECDPVNFAPRLALWSREFESPGFLSVIELEPGTCACGGGQQQPPAGGTRSGRAFGSGLIDAGGLIAIAGLPDRRPGLRPVAEVHLDVGTRLSGAPSGKLQGAIYGLDRRPIRFRSTRIDSFAVTDVEGGRSAAIAGRLRINRRTIVSFSATAVDRGTPGANRDSLVLTIEGVPIGGPLLPAGENLRTRNEIQVRAGP